MSSSDEIEQVPGAAKADEAQPVTGPELAGPEAIVAAAAEATSSISGAIAQAIASGQIDALGAQQLLIDQIVAELPGSPAELQRIREKIAELLSDDPTLARLLTP